MNDQATPAPAPAASAVTVDRHDLASVAAGLARAYAERERPSRQGRLHRV